MEPRIPKSPFEMIYADYCKLQGKNYLIIGDRLSGWTEVFRTKSGSPTAGSKGLCEALRHVFVTFGVPDDLSSDGGPEFSAMETKDFLDRWGVKHTLSSAYFPQSNGRAEVAVRITKRLLEDNVGPDGAINNDKIVRALLQLRNTPDKDCNLSPAEVLFGRRLKDAMPHLDKSVSMFESPQMHTSWREAWTAREKALRSRMVKTCENLEKNSKELLPLREGDMVFIQNQDPASGKPNKWDREGTVIQTGENDQYLVRVHGTGRVTLRNRRFLRKFSLRSPKIGVEDTHLASTRPTADATKPKVNIVDPAAEVGNQRHPPSAVDNQSHPPSVIENQCHLPSAVEDQRNSHPTVDNRRREPSVVHDNPQPTALRNAQQFPDGISQPDTATNVMPETGVPVPSGSSPRPEETRQACQPPKVFNQVAGRTHHPGTRYSARGQIPRRVYDASTGKHVAPSK